MREYRLAYGIVRLLIELVELELIGYDKSWALFFVNIHPQFGSYTVNDQFYPLVNSKIVTGVEVADQMHAAAQGAAGDIDKDILRAQSLSYEKIKLKPTDFRPETPDGVPVAVVMDAVGAVFPNGHAETRPRGSLIATRVA